MNPRDFLREFDKDFQLDSIPESDQLPPIQKTPQKYQESNQEKFDFDSNFSFSGLNDSSHFEAPKQIPSQDDPIIQSPHSQRIKPSLDDIPNYEQYLNPRSPQSVPNPVEEDNSFQQFPNLHENLDENLQFSQKIPTPTIKERPEPKQFSVPSFSFSSMAPSTPESQISPNEKQISSSQNNKPNQAAQNKPSAQYAPSSPQSNISSRISSSTTSTETQNMLNTIQELRKERAKDAEKLKNLMTENARLQAKLTMLEHTDVKVAELGSKVEQLLQDYLENEQVRAQQAAVITQLRQEVIILKSRMQASATSQPPNPGKKQRVRFD